MKYTKGDLFLIGLVLFGVTYLVWFWWRFVL